MPDSRLILSVLVIVAASILTGLGKITGESCIALITGIMLPSPLDKKPSNS